jgi:hypothetical protein
MLQKDVRKKFNTQNWIQIARRDHNPRQTIHRLKMQSNNAISDLTILANKLPNEEQNAIFSYKNIESLLQAILKGNNDKLNYYSKSEDKGEKKVFLGDNSEYDNNFNSRIIHLAALLVKEGIKKCIDQYSSKIERDSTLNKATIDNLKNAAEICDAIAFKLYLPKIELITREKKLTYLFNLKNVTEFNAGEPSEIHGTDNEELVEFLKRELTKWLGKELGQLRQIMTEFREIDKNKVIRCLFVTRYGKAYNCDLKLNPSQKDMIITFYDIDHENPIFKKDNLIVNLENNNYYVYLDSKV